MDENLNSTIYDNIIIGGGISGCSVAYELKKHSSSILLIDKREDVGSGASGAAGAFLSPLLGKPNGFKDLVTTSLKYATTFYNEITPEFIENCGTIRVPKNKEDRDKFESYIPFMEFEYEVKEDGYFFPIGSVVKSYNICKALTNDIEKLLNYEVSSIKFEDDLWIIDKKIKAKNLILTTGASINLIGELYFNIRPVWGQRIVIQTSTCINQNYHKECSISKSIQKDENTFITSIGATHHRNVLDKKIDNNDTEVLLKKANDIIDIQNVKVIQEIAGARASSVDYFPIVGELIDSKKTVEKFPYLKNGTHVNEDRFTRYKKLFLLNGIGGRGFVLAPYLAKNLVDLIVNKKDVDANIKTDRLFKRWVKKT